MVDRPLNPLELTHLRPAERLTRAAASREDERALRAAEAAAAARQGGVATWLLEGRGWPFVRPVLDFLALAVAVLLVTRTDGTGATADTEGPLVLLPVLIMALLAARGMYSRRLRISILDGIAPVVSSVSLATMALIAAEVYVFDGDLGSRVVVNVWALSLLAIGVSRVGAAATQRVARKRTLVGRPAIIVGAGAVGAKVATRFQENPEYGLRPIGFLDDHLHHESRVAHLPVLGSLDDIDWISSLSGAAHVVIAFSDAEDHELVGFAQRCTDLGLEVSVVPRLFEVMNDQFSYEAVGGLPLMALRPTRPHGSRFRFKHALDQTAAGVMIALLAPILLLIALGVKLTSPGPVLFRQRRVGQDGRVFHLLKFRSMRPARPGDAFAPKAGSAPGGIEGVDRRTAIGRFLRRSSLDELPQLLNVLRGDMSMVGPRPERPEFVELFSREVHRYDDRHRVRSGITGWAQVHGLRGQTSLSDRVEWDNFYIEHWSFALDLKILALTVVAVLRSAE